MWRGAGYGVDESLQCLFVHMGFLRKGDTYIHDIYLIPADLIIVRESADENKN